MLLLRPLIDVQLKGTSQVRRSMSGIRRWANYLRSTVPELVGTVMLGRLRRMEVAAAGRRKCAGTAKVQGTTRGPAQVNGDLTIDCQSAVGRGLSGF